MPKCKFIRDTTRFESGTPIAKGTVLDLNEKQVERWLRRVAIEVLPETREPAKNSKSKKEG